MAIFDNLITGAIWIVVLVYFGTTFYIDKQSKRKRHNNWDDTNDLYDYIDSDEDDAGDVSDDGGIDFDFGDKATLPPDDIDEVILSEMRQKALVEFSRVVGR